MASKKRYWRSVEELKDPALTQELANNEFAEELPINNFLGDDKALESSKTTRRDFLKFLGFSTAAATLAACEAPIVKSIPYVVKPEEITPGIPTHYASTMFDGYDYSNVIVKTREGRPIKILPNKDSKLFGTTNARVQASILSLYANNRLKEPVLNNKPVSWDALDKAVKSSLNSGGKTVLLTSSYPSPSTKSLINKFVSKNNAEHVIYDSVDYTDALSAAKEVFGKRALPFYDISSSQLIVGFNADFLDSLYGYSLDKEFVEARKPGENMLKHIQVESNLSLTGSNADVRYPLKPSDVTKTLAEVYDVLNGGSGSAIAKKIADELNKNGSKAVVLVDGDKDAHKLGFLINQKLKSTALSGKASYLREGDLNAFKSLVNDMNAGSVGTLIMFNVNPAYDNFYATDFVKGLAKTKMSVVIDSHQTQTSDIAKAIAPSPYWLASWGDFEPIDGQYALQQPTIQKIFNSRQFQNSLMVWAGMSETQAQTLDTANNDSVSSQEKSMEDLLNTNNQDPYYNYLKSFASSKIGNESFNQALYNGFIESGSSNTLSVNNTSVGASVSNLKNKKAADWELRLYTKSGIGDGRQSYNPWLQELPDPVTRTSWDNYFTINPIDADTLGIDTWNRGNERDGKMALSGPVYTATVNGVSVTAPVFIQPGQARGSIGLALGYGIGGQIALANNLDAIGVNAYPVYKEGQKSFTVTSFEATGLMHDFANIQMMNTLMGRYEIAREATLNQYLNEDSKHWNEPAVMPTHISEETPMGQVDLWRSFDRSPGLGPHFKLSVDLNACTGCGSCVIACQAENNVPVVGKDEIRRSRDMYWLRIDRYYSDKMQEVQPERYPYTQKEALEDTTLNEPEQYKILVEPAAENPDVIFQPMMCQHCNHAPCETVCPVGATAHGRQGQNQMAYNRCVGTRYCANNCPYKVRRFNWFNYAQNDKFDFHMNDDLGRMVLNPDVVVRQRGVMEKCSMCIQMTQMAILNAKKEGRTVKDNEFETACSYSCPTDALVFGDVNDSNSKVTALEEDKRKYEVLEEVGTKPNVFYHVKVRNRA